MSVNGTLYLAGPFNEETVRGITRRFSGLLNREVVFDVRRNDALIGGFLALLDGKVYDSSILARVKGMRQYLLEEEQSGNDE